jgi:hypothetical protein
LRNISKENQVQKNHQFIILKHLINMWKYKIGSTLKKWWLDFNLEKLPGNPRLRSRLLDYHPSDRKRNSEILFSK